MVFVIIGIVYVMYRVVIVSFISGVRCARFCVIVRWGAFKVVLLLRTCMGFVYMFRVIVAGVSVIRVVGVIEAYMVLDGDFMEWVCESLYVYNRCIIVVVYGIAD